MDPASFPATLLEGEEDGEYIIPAPIDLDCVNGIDYTVHPAQNAIELFIQTDKHDTIQYVPIIYDEDKQQILTKIKKIKLTSTK